MHDLTDQQQVLGQAQALAVEDEWSARYFEVRITSQRVKKNL